MSGTKEKTRSWVSATTKAIYSHLPYDTHQAIIFLPASSSREGQGGGGGGGEDSSQRWRGSEGIDSTEEGGSPRTEISGEEARRFYEDLTSSRSPGHGSNHTRAGFSRPQRQRPKTAAKVCKRKGENSGALPPSKRPADGAYAPKTDLFKLAQEGRTDRLRSTLSLGTHDINMTDQFNWTLLMCAAHAGHMTTVQYLLDHGALWRGVADRRGNTAVHLALIGGHYDIARLIETYGVTLDEEGGEEEEEEEEEEDEEEEKVKKEGQKEKKMKTGGKKDAVATAELDTSLNHRGHEKTFYCDVCKMNVITSQSPSSPSIHATSVVHQFSCQHSPSVSPYVIPETNRGYQLLLRGGWCPEAGLGPQQQGQRFPVKTVLKQDRRGLGDLPKGRREPSRVTHFSAYDTDAVRSSRQREGVEGGVLAKRKRDVLKAVKKERQWEVRMRRYMNTD